MRRRFILLANLLVLALGFNFQPAWADQKAAPDPNDPTDANIALMEGEILQNWQYAQHPFDAEISGKFLDRYLETLDYSHIYFLESDIKEFDAYRTNLPSLTMEDHDLSPCWVIFSRFMKRAGERVDYVTNLLATTKFAFTGMQTFRGQPPRFAVCHEHDGTEGVLAPGTSLRISRTVA